MRRARLAVLIAIVVVPRVGWPQGGTPVGPEFRVNTYTTGGQTDPAVGADMLGNFVVAWDSELQDGSDYGVFAQRYSQIVPVELMHFRVE